MSTVLGVIPCAGASSRMGRSKALLDAHGEPFLRRVIRAQTEGGCDSIVVVVRDLHGAEAELALECGARVILNPDPADGPISSIRAALAVVAPDDPALVLHPVDHPLVRASTVAALIRAAGARPEAIVVPRYGPRRGHPVLFPRAVFPELQDPALEGGARTVVRRRLDRVVEVAVEDPGVVQDIDRPRDYETAFGRPLPALGP